MKYVEIIALVIAGICAYAFHHNPQACEKLGTDVASQWPVIKTDLSAILDPNPQYSDASYVAALAESQRTGKNMLLVFDGSEWCPSCQALDEEVLPSPQWKTFASQFVVAKLEVPHDHPDDDAQKTPSQRIADNFGVRGYPTLLIVDANKRELRRCEGYSPGYGMSTILMQLQSTPQ